MMSISGTTTKLSLVGRQLFSELGFSPFIDIGNKDEIININVHSWFNTVGGDVQLSFSKEQAKVVAGGL